MAPTRKVTLKVPIGKAAKAKAVMAKSPEPEPVDDESDKVEDADVKPAKPDFDIVPFMNLLKDNQKKLTFIALLCADFKTVDIDDFFKLGGYSTYHSGRSQFSRLKKVLVAIRKDALPLAKAAWEAAQAQLPAQDQPTQDNAGDDDNSSSDDEAKPGLKSAVKNSKAVASQRGSNSGSGSKLAGDDADSEIDLDDDGPLKKAAKIAVAKRMAKKTPKRGRGAGDDAVDSAGEREAKKLKKAVASKRGGGSEEDRDHGGHKAKKSIKKAAKRGRGDDDAASDSTSGRKAKKQK